MKYLGLILTASLMLNACGGGTSTPVTTTPPLFSNQAPSISGTPLGAVEKIAYSFTPLASDPDGDNLIFSVTGNPDWLGFNTGSGELSGTPDVNDLGLHENINISVSDGKASRDLTFSVNVTPDILEQALRTGDAKDIPDTALVTDELTAVFESAKTKYNEARAKIFGLSGAGALTADSLTNISWDPTHDAALLRASFGFNEAVLLSNDVTNPNNNVQGATLGIVGENATGRYMVLGSNPMRNKKRGGVVSADMETFLKNSLSWLTARDDLMTKNFNVVIAQTGQNFYFPDQQANREWLTANYPDTVAYNDATVCNGVALAGCITADTDMLIISQVLFAGEDAPQIANTVKAAMAQGTAVLYLHYDGNYGELAKALFPVFKVGYVKDNYWQRQQLTAIDPTAGFGQIPSKIAQIKTMLERLASDGFSFNLAACDDKDCPVTSSYVAEFDQAAKSIRATVNDLDVTNTRIFSQTAYRYEKLLVLFGDIIRRDVVYPMDKTTTPRREFLTSLLADHIIYNGRDIAPAQANMGNFSRSDFSHITPTSKSVDLIAKPSFRSTGAYALPGQTFTVTRTDNSDVETEIFINTLRSGATHEFENNGYKRPKYLQSQHMKLVTGTPLSLTSVYGGPIQISFSTKDVPVKLSFENIGEHPYWNGPEDDASFTAAIAAFEYDWAELVTAAFEVHSKTEKMQETIDDPKWGNAASVAAGAERYMSNLPHALAGFKGVGIDVVDEIHDFAAGNGIEMETLDKVKHMNADQANCGYGCSGNPYDAYWSYDPLGHGDIHELGHGLERGYFLFDGWERHATTNPYSYYAKSTYGVDTGSGLGAMNCQNLPFEQMFTRVQQSRLQADPFAYMQAQSTGKWNQSVVMTIQMMMAAQAEGVLGNGWHLLARLHVIERAFRKADNNDADWLSARSGLGFGGYSRNEARSLSNDDWMLIALSHATGRDMRAFLTTWGLGASQTARDHVAGFGFPVMPVQFFLADKDNYCLGLDKPAVPIDGAQIWP